MHKNATKCNETLSKWCKNKHGASKIIDTFETYQWPRPDRRLGVRQSGTATTTTWATGGTATACMHGWTPTVAKSMPAGVRRPHRRLVVHTKKQRLEPVEFFIHMSQIKLLVRFSCQKIWCDALLYCESAHKPLWFTLRQHSGWSYVCVWTCDTLPCIHRFNCHHGVV
jgi:hypothetical protein